jgi:hypothetical protein
MLITQCGTPMAGQSQTLGPGEHCTLPTSFEYWEKAATLMAAVAHLHAAQTSPVKITLQSVSELHVVS